MKTVILIFLTILSGFHAISDAQVADTVKIGFMIADWKSPAAVKGAELAIKKANENAGRKGNHFKLVVRSMEGPWGTGSREATNLIFDDRVAGIVGSHDGRNAHIVEQVCTKARVVFISAWPADPTLSQAFVPWFFNCVPNNTQQAELLINETYIKKAYKNIAVISDPGYDSEIAVTNFIKKARLEEKPLPLHLKYGNGADLKKLVEQINEKKAECLIMCTTPAIAGNIIRILKEAKVNIPVYGTLSLLDENELPGKDFKSFEDISLISAGFWFSSEGLSFIKEFKNTYGYSPGSVAAYAYDAVSLMVGAINNAGLEYDVIQKSLAAVRYKGVTGMVQFDNMGNRKGPFRLMVIKNGMPVEVQ